ncbi:hypothetical protein CI109_104660 [Kwoniella shandongensis]|uniref:Uncharacterized protein n=1 Tax=Kwoniella shandongensis TaxID=1734106 RepID=A0A5M6BVE0_9TREE|nr:uncharacterized protein CI109_004826 [Kwoniella shandongensis]KAA5526826.1 hypothetical protein CI109_004826 [Kwoniella shandongensis]
MPSSEAGSSSASSSMRSRKAPPPVQIQRSSTPHNDDGDDDEDNHSQPKSSAGFSSNSNHFPGGLPLPAVKGTIGGIDSPRRHTRGSASISTIRDDSNTPESGQVTPRPKGSDDAEGQEVAERSQPPPPPPPSAKAVFRADPTVKSCLLELKMDKKDEITRLFGVA